MAAEGDEIELLTSPAEDWMPVFQPITYVFQRTGPSLAAFYPTLIVKVEVSHNGTDFSEPITAGIISVPIGTLDRYTVNPAPYLAAVFSISSPVGGVDTQLYKYYRLLVGRSDEYDGTTGTVEITTDGAYCVYAASLPALDAETTVLSAEPTYGYYDGYLGIQTVIDHVTNEIKNNIVLPPDTPVNVCPQYPKYMYWLNRQGGWQAWVFNGKHEYEDDIAEGVTWVDADGLTHTASLGPVQHSCAVYSGFVPRAIYDTIAGIRHAIKVYHFDYPDFREVNIERGSYPKYREGDKRREVNFTFTYAEPLTVQTA